MRILFVTQTAHPWGGVEAWLEDLTAALSGEHEVTVGLVRGARFHDPERYRAVRRIAVPTIEIDATTGTAEGRVRAVIQAIRATGPDVVVPVSIADALEAVRRLKKRKAGVRLLCPLHGIGSPYIQDIRAFRGIIDMAVATNRLGERALIAVSNLAPERVDYALCGVPAASRKPIFDAPERFRLIYAARLTRLDKRARDIVPFCDELQRRGVEFTLDVAGDGEELPYLRKALAAFPVTFKGLLSREDLYRCVYPGAAAMLIFSSAETGPIAAWEAMRNGATLVTTAYRGLRAERRIVDGVNAVVAPVGDVAALAAAAEQLARDPHLLERLRRAAFETAERDCTIERSVALWRAAFERCAQLPPATDTQAVPLPTPSSRIDRVVGTSLGESVRSILGRRMIHSEPGGEWPHTFHASDAEMDAAIARLDR